MWLDISPKNLVMNNLYIDKPFITGPTGKQYEDIEGVKLILVNI